MFMKKGSMGRLVALWLAAAVVTVSGVTIRADPGESASATRSAGPAQKAPEKPTCRTKAAHRQLRVRVRVFEGKLPGSEGEGSSKLLAEPQMITEDGRSCSFLTGGERAVEKSAGK